MRSFVLVSLCCVSCLGFAPYAKANVEAYCEAYAIDFANLSETDEALWQGRRDEARAACLLQYQDAPAVVKAKPKRVKPATVAKKEVVKTQPESVAKAGKPKADKVAATAVEPEVEPTAAAPKKPNIKVGTPEWYDYCDRKYSSFNRKTGKYLSKTGVERKCLVTADFQ
jgi:hypothetical protein